MAEITQDTRAHGNIELGLNIEPTGQSILDARLQVKTLSDLYGAYVEGNNYYPYMVVTVEAEAAQYMLTDVSKVTSAEGWKRVDAGAAIGNVTEAIQDIKNEVDDLKSSLSAPLNYKGSKNTYEDLPTDAANGDVYNVVEAHNNIPAGTNYVWNGEANEWDPLGGSIDLSGYATKEDLANQKTLYEAADLALGNRIDTLTTTINNNKQEINNKIGVIESKLDPDTEGSLASTINKVSEDLQNLSENLTIKTASTTKSNGVGLAVNEGELSVVVDADQLATAINEKITHPAYTANDLKIGGTQKEGSTILPTNTIKQTLEDLEASITTAVSGGITAVNAGPGITVDGTTNAKTVRIKLTDNSALTIDENNALTLVWEEIE